MSAILIAEKAGSAATIAPSGGSTEKTALARFDARTQDLEARAGSLLTPVGIARLPDPVEVLHTDDRYPYSWVFLQLIDDPTYKDGTLAMPYSVKRKLRRLDRLGVSFDVLVIGHEVDKGDAVSLDPTGPHDLMKLVTPKDHMKKTPNGVKAMQSSATVARAGLKGAATAVALSAGAVVAAPLMVLAAAAADPVLFGGITVDGKPTPGTNAALFLIAHWS